MIARRTAALIVLAFVAPASARNMYTWSYEELFKMADVVVIAAAGPTKDVGAPDVLKKEVQWVPVRTQFTQLALVKGKLEGKTFDLDHYRLHVPDGVLRGIMNGPTFITFDGRADQTYLLFLKREPSGALTPVAGQMDPEDSIKLVSNPVAIPEKPTK